MLRPEDNGKVRPEMVTRPQEQRSDREHTAKVSWEAQLEMSVGSQRVSLGGGECGQEWEGGRGVSLQGQACLWMG